MMMKKQLLLLVMMLLPLVASAHDIEVQNGDGVTIYYNYINNGTELAVTSGGTKYTGNIVIPEEVTYMNVTLKVTRIGNVAFSYCSGLTSVTIPNSVTSIGSDAFSGCSGLTSVTIPNGVTSIDGGTFRDCSGLTSIIIPNSVTSIVQYAFSGCSSLTFIIIPNSVTSIGYRAFSGCSGLTSVTIGNSVTSIDWLAFENCSGLKKVIVSDISAWCGINFGDSSANPLYYSHHLYSDENTEIKDLVFPNSMTSVSKYAFVGCSGLNSVAIPSSVTSIGEFAFALCSGLTTIKVESGNTKYDSRNNCNAIIETASSTLMVGCKSTVIPNSVTSIGNYAFDGCSSLTSVIIPSSVTNIGSYAFVGCIGLTSVIIPSSVTSIGDTAFRDCSGLISIIIPNSVTSIGNNAFWGCSRLTSVAIPSSVTSIGSYAFYECSGLQKVIVSDIAAWCGIKFGDNPLSYAHHLYSDENTEIKDLVIPNSVTSIGRIAFSGCTGLTSVTIPNSVTSIGNSAFYGVDLLTIISMIENPFFVYDNVFSLNTLSYATLYVPKGTIDKYKATECWKYFNNIVEGDPSGVNVVENTKNNNTTIYNLNGVRQPEPKKGVNIINGKKVAIK